MPSPIHLSRLAIAAGAGFFLLAGCASNDKKPPELSDRQVCLDHYKDDPLGREVCYQSGQDRGRTSPPDMSPHQLPVKTGQPSD